MIKKPSDKTLLFTVYMSSSYFHPHFFLPIIMSSGIAVTRPYGNVHDVSSNPAAARNEKWTLGTSLQTVAQWSRQDLSGRLI